MKSTPKQPRPLARQQGLVIQELPGEILVYDLKRDRAHCLNDTAAQVWRRCDGQKTVNEIALALGGHFDCLVDEKIVWLALNELEENHLLESTAVPSAAVMKIDRRTLVRTLGIAAVVALPVITSILAPTVQAVVSCLPTGSTCTIAGVPCCNGGCPSDGGTCP